MNIKNKHNKIFLYIFLLQIETLKAPVYAKKITKSIIKRYFGPAHP